MRSILQTAVVLAVIATAAHADGPITDRTEEPPEESRLSRSAFHAGLMERGLAELLELHLRDFPPTSEIESLLMMREIKLAESADPTLGEEDRLAAIHEANNLLEQVIKEAPQDRHRFEWRLTLAHSLIYDEAEPFLTNILYRGGHAEDRRELLDRSDRAVRALATLLAELQVEYERIDKLSIREFERLAGGGYVEQLDRLAPRAEYLLLWAWLYNALPRDDADPTRARRLHEVLDGLEEHPALLFTPHQTSGVQVQTLLLAGMANRLLNRHERAREHLDRALSVAEGLEDQSGRLRIEWAVTLAWIERIRNDTEAGRFERALQHLHRFRDQVSTTTSDDAFGMEVVGVLLERWVLLSRAVSSDQDSRPTDAARYRENAWQVIERLARDHPDHRDELYTTLYGMIEPDTDPAQLDPVENCALIAGLLSEASRSPDGEAALLDRAVVVGERFLADTTRTAASLRPEILYNLAVAHYRRGRLAAAVERFLEIVEDHPRFGRARQAATFAVQLAAELHGDPSLRDHPEVTALYRRTLEALLSSHSDTEAARYWRFYYAQLLDEQEEYDLAAAQYDLVDKSHEHYLDSLFYRTRCLVLSLRRYAGEHPLDRTGLDQRTDEVLLAQRSFVVHASVEPDGPLDPDRASTLRHLLARARLLTSEVHVMPHASRPARALELLADFEDRFPDQRALTGRVWRVRLLAYEKLDRFDEATRAIPAYVEADPDRAGIVLQTLYESVVEDVETLRTAGDTKAAQQKAETALVLARQIHNWIIRTDAGSDEWDRRAVAVQLAEANLRAGRYGQARELFDPLIADAGGGGSAVANLDARVLLGYAESLYQLGEFEAALPEFNRLATRLRSDDPIRWKALLRDLQCRTRLEHPPQGITKVIEQQMRLYPEMGGRLLTPQSDKLLRENQRRLHTRP